MSDMSRRRPSAALIIACVALFASLGGGALAAKGLIDSNDIENDSIRGKDIKKDTLKGKDIKESKLGEVPSAATATNAADAARLAGVEAVRVEPFTLTTGQSQEILQRGAFTLTATCSINEGGDDFARVLIATSVDNAAFDGSDDTDDLDIATPAADRDFIEAQAATGTPNVDQETDGTAFAPDGTEILGQEAFAATALSGDGPGVCRFGGMFFVD